LEGVAVLQVMAVRDAVGLVVGAVEGLAVVEEAAREPLDYQIFLRQNNRPI
jgi:hypothetical protein